MASLADIFTTVPAASLFSFPPNSSPALPPPPAGSMASAPPFDIPERLYQAALEPWVPLTLATLYAVTAKALNKYNLSTGKKPWAVTKTRAFFGFVVVHNVFLAVYSAWTWWGMLGALRRSVVSPAGPSGWPGTVDSFCRLTGPPGIGNGAFFDEDTRQWQHYGVGAALVPGVPNRAEPGRIWSEGLAFYGWFFYLSKFYEVLDTLIILAKGKLSSTLQTYHHAGAMMCMWAGMRYMSAPIWMFVFVNSGIHAMMYTYYTLTAFSIKVPMFVKRTLTSLQITQFLVGASYAMSHSFVSYAIPVVLSIAKKTSAAAGEPETAPEPLLDNVKGWLYEAVSKATSVAASQVTPPAGAASVRETVVKEYEVAYGQKLVSCATSSGETFAIWLNVLYLAPLTYLFVKFFITSYLRRSNAESRRVKKAAGERVRRLSNVTLAEKAGWDAAKNLEKEVYGPDSPTTPKEEENMIPAPNGKATLPNGQAKR